LTSLANQGYDDNNELEDGLFEIYYIISIQSMKKRGAGMAYEIEKLRRWDSVS